MAEKPMVFSTMREALVTPTIDAVLAFCSLDPIERVFLEDVARRGLGQFSAVQRDGRLLALCHVGANIVPSGSGCEALAPAARSGRVRMIVGEERAVGELWEGARASLPAPREDRPGQPVYTLRTPPQAGGARVRAATVHDLPLLVPACAAAHEEELGGDPLELDTDAFQWRTEAQIQAGRSWIWAEDGAILFKAEASAWTPSAVQLQQVWVDPPARRLGNGTRGLRDLCRLLLAEVPAVCLFVRAENAAAIRLYERVGMKH